MPDIRLRKASSIRCNKLVAEKNIKFGTFSAPSKTLSSTLIFETLPSDDFSSRRGANESISSIDRQQIKCGKRRARRHKLVITASD